MKVLITDGIAPEGAKILTDAGLEITQQFFEPADLVKEIVNFDAIIVRSATKVTKEVIQASKLKVIARSGVGVDNIDTAFAKEIGIPVVNTPGASSISVAELTIAHMFNLCRGLSLSNPIMKSGGWPKKELSNGIELTGKTLGIIGLGAIGIEVAKRALGLGMKVIYNSRTEKSNELNLRFVDTSTLFAEADFISLHIPFNKEKGIEIGELEFAQMKDGAILVNTSRGEVIDEVALLNALKSGKLRAAALDVFQNEPITDAQKELVSLPNVSVTPHIAASTLEAQLRVSTEIAEKVVKELNK
jgi:D-3-phosphoglycerate dehydrogenase